MGNYCTICKKQLNQKPKYDIYLDPISRIWKTEQLNDFCSKKCAVEFIEKCQKELNNL